jgi:hypothetical protein
VIECILVAWFAVVCYSILVTEECGRSHDEQAKGRDER